MELKKLRTELDQVKSREPDTTEVQEQKSNSFEFLRPRTPGAIHLPDSAPSSPIQNETAKSLRSKIPVRDLQGCRRSPSLPEDRSKAARSPSLLGRLRAAAPRSSSLPRPRTSVITLGNYIIIDQTSY